MTATPAWPPRSTPRLYIDQPLAEAGDVRIDGAAAHYLIHVMRMKPDAPLILFDDIGGEWLGRAVSVGKRDLVVALDRQTRPRETVPDFWLCAAPIKKGRIDWVVEKATELGVARILPVVTQRTIVDRVKPERLRAHMIEAAEQCGRTALPVLDDAVKLAALLKDWPAERALFFADELGGTPAAAAMRDTPGPAAVLIGPEGGFTDDERAAIHACPAAVPITLGPRILRAETAALAATSLWMGVQGDWQG